MNEANKAMPYLYEYVEGFVQLLAPIAPHIGEELWQILGNEESLTYVPWPTWVKDSLVEDGGRFSANGKLRGKQMSLVG